MTKNNRFILQALIIMAFFFLPGLLHAQPGFGDDVDDVPVDGGLSLLVAAGVGYAIKKTRHIPKKKGATATTNK